MTPIDRVILIVLDSVGVGAAPDAARFGDQSANTLLHIGEWCAKNGKKFSLPNLSRWGLGGISPAPGVGPAPQSQFQAAFGKMRELSPGKDTTTGHWELAGHVLTEEFPVFERGFDPALLNEWAAQNNLPGWIGNKPASGTTILDELGEEHLRTGKPIVYTSGDSVLQVACSEESFGLERLYAICKSARKLVDPLGVGRVIARPFLGKQTGQFKRTENRRDYSVPPPSPNLLDVLVERGCFTAGVGKIEDIFAHRGVTIVEHTGRNETSLVATSEVMQRTRGKRGLIFTNLIDFDQLHGHRRNASTYADALMEFDNYLPKIEAECGPRDLVILTADHGNDPTHAGTDHTRENVPLLVWSPSPSFHAEALGTLDGFASVARLCLESMGYGADVARMDGATRAPAIAAKIGLG